VPDLIRLTDCRQDVDREFVVSVRDDRDPHLLADGVLARLVLNDE
jgi:hypothetical protein